MRGVYTALVTPFNSKNEIDLPAYKKLLQDQKSARVTGVIPCGTTGETPTLTPTEKRHLIMTALEELKGSGVKVIAGTGTNSTAESVEFSKWASDQGVDGVLIVTPYYNKPSQAGLEAHYRAIADAVLCDVILYNVPGRTGVSFTAQTVANLAAHPRMRTIKEATGNVAFTSEILDTLAMTKRSMDVLSGDDATYLPLMAVGAAGVISVASNLFPRGMVAIQEALESGRLEDARKLHAKWYPLFRDLFIESNPGPIKHAMQFAGMCDARVRAPLAPIAGASAEKLEASLKRCGVEKGKPL
ncbi:MAG: 4-hydroxy-tetrahydrodipicolinate synthase [Bdellovibrionota bacterium]